VTDPAWRSMTFLPGEHTLVMGESIAVLTTAAPDSPVIATVLSASDRRAEVAAAFVELLRGMPGADLPDFAAAVLEDDGVRLFVRGAFVVHGDHLEGQTHDVTGDRLLTWSEVFLTQVAEVRMWAEATSISSFDDVAYQAPVGVLPASAVRIQVAQPGPADSSGRAVPMAPGPPVGAPGVAVDEQAGPASGEPPAGPSEQTPCEVPATRVGAETLLHLGDSVGEATSEAVQVEADPGASVDEGAVDERVDEQVSPNTGSYDDLFGSTMIRSVEDAAMRPLESAEAASGSGPATEPVAEADQPTLDELAHDGRTILGEELRQMRRERAQQSSPATGAGVLAVHCPAGHPNPAHAVSCRVCGVDIAEQTPAAVERPVLARIVGTGIAPVLVDRTVLVGRSPRLRGHVADGMTPVLLAIDSPDKDVSRTHLELRVEGWTLLVTDLHSANGTTVSSPGRPVVRLRPGEPHLVDVGTDIHLADEVALRLEAP